jgi:hypothetical protein
MNWTKFIAIACLVVLGSSLRVASSPVLGPSPESSTGRIMGTLLDVNDARVNGANIKVEGPRFKWEGESDEAGDFTADMPPGTYRIYVRAKGFRSFESVFLTVKSDVTEMVNIHLEVLPIIDSIPVESKKRHP